MTATGDWVTSYVYDGATAGPVGEIYTKNAGATASALGIWDNTGQLIFERDKWMTWATDVIQVKLLKDMIYRSSSFYNLRIADGDIEQQTLKGLITVLDDTGGGGPAAIGSAYNYELFCLDVSNTPEGTMAAWLTNHGSDLWVFTTERRYADNEYRLIHAQTSTGSGTGYQQIQPPTTLQTSAKRCGGNEPSLKPLATSRTLLEMSGLFGTWVHRQTIQTIHHRGSQHDIRISTRNNRRPLGISSRCYWRHL